MKKATLFDRISTGLLITGFVTARLNPIFIIGPLFNIISLTAYFLGYTTWSIAAWLHPDNNESKDERLYFLNGFKRPYQLAAVIGLIATVLCLLAPMLIIPTAWIYVISNTFWAISENNKRKKLARNDDSAASKKQAHFVRYTALVALVSLLTAIAATVAVLFPATVLILVPTTTILSVSLLTTAICFWGKFLLSPSPEAGATASLDSTQRLSAHLSLKKTEENQAVLLTQIQHHPPLWAPKKEEKKEEIIPLHSRTYS